MKTILMTMGCLAGLSAAGVDVSLVPGGARGIYLPGEVPELTLTVSNVSAKAETVTLNLRTTDYFGREVAQDEMRVDVAAKGIAQKTLRYPQFDRPGHWVTTATWPGGSAEGALVTAGAVPPTPDRLFGISCFALNTTEVYRRMGVGSKGLSLNWSWLESSVNPGLENINLDGLLKEVREMRAAGIHVIGMLCASDARTPSRFLKEGARDIDDPIRDVPVYLAENEKFFRLVATTFRDEIEDWSAGCEINIAGPASPYLPDRYVELVGLISRTLKSVNPKNRLMGLSTSGGDGRDNPRFRYSRGLLPRVAKFIDGLAPDQYTAGQCYGDGFDNLNSEDAQLREIMQASIALADEFGLKHVAIDEKGASFVRALPCSASKDALAADVVAREFIILKTLPRVEHWLYYRPYNWNGQNAIDYGMWEKANPRHVVASYAATARQMAHVRFVKGLDVHGDIPCWVFERDGRFFATLWYNGGRPLAFRMPAGSVREARDVLGNPLDAADGTVTLSSSPVYVFFDSKATLEKAIAAATFDVPVLSATLETMAADRTLLVVRNLSAKPLRVKASGFAAEPAQPLPSALAEPLEVAPLASRTVELDFSAAKSRLTLTPDAGAAVTVEGAFAPYRVKRISGWDDLADAPEIALDDPDRQAPGYADLTVNGAYNGLDDLSARGRFGYDDKAFYLEFFVKDDVQENYSLPARLFVGDCVQFAFDTGNNARLKILEGNRGFDDDDYNIVSGLAYGKSLSVCFGAAAANRARLNEKAVGETTIVRDEPKGVTHYRVRIPFADLAPLRPEKGRVFGFSYLVFDYDHSEKTYFNYYIQFTPGIASPPDPSKFAAFMFD